jgi:hypothetical protein
MTAASVPFLLFDLRCEPPMLLRVLLVLVSVPVLSAACCCGPAPTIPGDAVYGAWVLEGRMPTGSALGELDSVRIDFLAAPLVPEHRLSGRSVLSGDTVWAPVRLDSDDPRQVAFTVERTAAEGAFVVNAAGQVAGGGEMAVTFSGADGAALGTGVFRRR